MCMHTSTSVNKYVLHREREGGREIKVLDPCLHQRGGVLQVFHTGPKDQRFLVKPSSGPLTPKQFREPILASVVSLFLYGWLGPVFSLVDVK